jgi:hypothetical protein
MSERISKDQAVTAMILWNHFQEQAEKDEDKSAFLATYGISSARYAMVEMAAEADAIFYLLPEEEQSGPAADTLFYSAILDCFDYRCPVPKLKHSREAVADWFEASFGLTETSDAAHTP